MGECNDGSFNIGKHHKGFFNIGIAKRATDDEQIMVFNKPVPEKYMTEIGEVCGEVCDLIARCILSADKIEAETLEKILSLPNFDPEIFEAITGITVKENNNE